MACLSSTQMPGIERVAVILIRPSRYDDQGFPWRFRWAVLPSNSLAVMHALTTRALIENLPEEIPFEIYMLEDGITGHARELESLYRSIPRANTKLIVCFVGVQTAEFPRACNLIRKWQKRGAICVIGGFHVSGSLNTLLYGVQDSKRPDIPCPHIMPPEIKALMDRGVVVFHEEAEETWETALGDILKGEPQSFYRGGKPDLRQAPLPVYDQSYFTRHFATRTYTFDTGRGCPFTCSFCAIINVQGRTSRFRNPTTIAERIRAICEEHGSAEFFFVDDNFARNPEAEAILDGLIELRNQGHQIHFMIEADLACAKSYPWFIPKLGRAGCTQIFMGVESMNPGNLVEVNKGQNHVDKYADLFALCHQHGISVHAGYMIGFPNDTPESVKRDVAELFRAGVDQASFFILSPVPGSEDHVRAFVAGVKMDADLSRFDSFHTVVDHPVMSRGEWSRTYREAWVQFYTTENLIAALKRFDSRKIRLSLIRNYFWYRWSAITEGTHPMIAGFWRHRPYRERRPDAPPLSYPKYLLSEVTRYFRYLTHFATEFYQFQHIFFEVECAPTIERAREEWNGRVSELGTWFRLTFGRKVSRVWLNSFWRKYAANRWQLLWNPLRYHWHIKVIPACLTEAIYGMRFLFALPKLVRG